MSCKIIINAAAPEECRIVKIKNSKIEMFQLETETKEITQYNIYKGIVTRVEPSLQAVFIDYGAERHGFLQKQEIHSDYFQDDHTGDRSLQNLIKPGQEMLVQVIKDPILKKGAMLTNFISLPGRHVVLMPGSNTNGVSRKIEDEEERKRLKEIIESLKLSDDYGVIVRTAGQNCTKAMISKDLRYLLRLWKDILKRVSTEPGPAMLYKDQNISIRMIRDYFTDDVTEILIDNPALYKEVRNFIKIISPKHLSSIKQYKSEKPIFTKYRIEEQIASIFERRVELKTGGSIVIEQTEALVAIDVNSGKSTQHESIEQTALQTNLEASEEIARQLRLRDLGGIIVIDFIDMKETKNKLKVETALKDHLKIDKARTKISKISKMGLMEMSRQRLRPAIGYGTFVACNYCKGKGIVQSTESLSLSFLRSLSLETLKENISIVRGIVPSDIASYLLNKKRSDLLALEERRNVSILIEANNDMVPGEHNFIVS
ncbi:MAG: Rne/Rng family ribonuclease [Desulfobacterales bacterium]|nr:Rne/Rng family ribonuclease [Desulfobacterales bacterium]